MAVLIDVLKDTTLDCIKMLPFLLGAFLVLEGLEHISTQYQQKLLAQVGMAGPLVGALLGCVPQCGFSVMAANFFAAGMISPGTLLAVFLATSDEAILIMLGNPGSGHLIGQLLLTKIILAVAAGYFVDLVLGRFFHSTASVDKLCKDCGCNDEHGILKPALRHTLRIFIYLYVFTFLLNLLVEGLGVEQLSRLLLADSLFQPVLAAVIGLIPNCAASVILSQLYLSGVISFASAVAGLSTGAGVGLIVLFKMNDDKKENFKILGCLLTTGILAGIIIGAFA